MHILITAGDPSADTHAAHLMAAIRRQIPEVVFEGFGGPAMELEGLRSIAHLQDLAVTGFWEVAKRTPYFTNLLKRAADLLASKQHQLFIPVDYPGFNMRLAAKAKASSVPVAWYIAPQLWAWGKNRAEKLARVVDMLLVVFPFEVDYFRQFGINTQWVGHPFIPPSTLPLHNQGKSVVLMPGSRTQELKHHVPILVDIIEALPRALGYTPEFIVPQARMIGKGALAPLQQVGATLVDNAHLAMVNADVGLIKAGTSTLEAAILGLPFATFYKTSWLSYQISKRLVTVDTVTMMNLLLKRRVVSEFIQHDVHAHTLVDELVSLITDESRRKEFTNACTEVRSILGIGTGGASAADRAAQAIVELMR